MLRKILLLAGLVGLIGIQKPATADVVAYPLVYDIDDQPFEGYVARNEGFGDDQPVVLLVHDWDGLNRYEKMRANMLSTQGYTVTCP